MGIANTFPSLAYPQSNDQVEVVNKIIKGVLKKKREERKGAWVDECCMISNAISANVQVYTTSNIMISIQNLLHMDWCYSKCTHVYALF